MQTAPGPRTGRAPHPSAAATDPVINSGTRRPAATKQPEHNHRPAPISPAEPARAEPDQAGPTHRHTSRPRKRQPARQPTDKAFVRLGSPGRPMVRARQFYARYIPVDRGRSVTPTMALDRAEQADGP
jgi:hypothetical protein